jgi:hypothetical protein
VRRAAGAIGLTLLWLACLGGAQAQVPASAAASSAVGAPDAAPAASAPVSPGMRAMLDRARKIREIVAAQPAASAPDRRTLVERIAPPDRPRSGAEVNAVLQLHRFDDLVGRTLRAAQPPVEELHLTVDIDAEGQGHRCAQVAGTPPAPQDVLQRLCGELERIYFGRKAVGPPMARLPLALRLE